jgi:hypothetical protein
MPEYLHQRSNHHRAQKKTKLLMLIAMALTGCAMGIMIINKAITQKYWDPNLGKYSTRLMGLSMHTDEIDIVFVGSSHVLYSVNPLEFDSNRDQQDAGASYNMGVEAAFMPVQLHTLRKLQEFQMPRLRYVFFEPMLLDVPFPGPAEFANAFTPRNRYLYNLEYTRIAMASRWFSNRSLVKRLGGVAAIGTAWAIHTSNVGVIADLLLRQNPVSTGQSEWAWSQRGRNSKLEVKEFEQDRIPDLEAGYRTVSEAELVVLERMLAEIELAGAEPVILLPPNRSRAGWTRAIRDAVQERFPNVMMLDYSFDTNPLELYFQPDLWADVDHLNEDGAKAFSALLARDWSSYTRSLNTAH